MDLFNKSKEEEEIDIINSSRTNHLYMKDFGKGKFFNVVFQDDENHEIELTKKTRLGITFIKETNSVKGLKITKIIGNEIKGDISISCFDLNQLKSFVEFISKLNLNDISERRIHIPDDMIDEIDESTKHSIGILLAKPDGNELVQTLLSNGLLTQRDIVNTGYRKEQLEIFRLLLYENYLVQYKLDNELINSKDEIAWQHFFQKNEWIFGYGLDYQYKTILQKEVAVSDSQANGSGIAYSDFLLGDKRFTTFVELKKPDTKLFSNIHGRVNTWKLSKELIEAVSQILEHKASGLLKLEKQRDLTNDRGDLITQHAYDSKVILIIGSWSELASCEHNERRIKEKTFELFRRDSRNIEFLTYDELFDRAKFILEGVIND